MRSLRTGIALAASLAVALVVPGEAQLLLPAQFLGRGARSYSSSIMVSSSWQHGDHMHQQLHSVRSEEVHHGPISQHTQSEVLCRDGLCRHMTHVSKPAIAPWARLAGLRGFLRGHMRPAGADAPVFVPVAVTVVPHPVALRVVAPSTPAGHSPSDMLAAYIAVSAGAIALTAFIMRQLGSAVAAREPPLRVLGEPLAPAAAPAAAESAGEGWQAWVEEARQKERAAAVASAATKSYLSELYVQAAAAIDAPWVEEAKQKERAAAAASAATKSYLSELYVQAAAAIDARATSVYVLRVFERASV